MNKELIEKLKKNERATIFLSEEERDILEKAGRNNRSFLDSGGEFKPDNTESMPDEMVFRLKPDYNPEPESEIIETETMAGREAVKVEHPSNFKYYMPYIGRFIDGWQLVGFRYSEQTGDELYNFPAGYKYEGCTYEGNDTKGEHTCYVTCDGNPEDFITASKAVWRKVK